MGFRLGVFTAAALAALSTPAGAAELTRVQSAEPGDPFALQFSFRWDREQQRGTISRESPRDPASGEPFGSVQDLDVLRHSRVKNDFVTRVAVALYTDLELRVEIPYALADDTAWRHAFVNGMPVTNSSIALNDIDAMGRPCGDPASGVFCPLFPVSSSDTTVYHGGRLGDVRAGLAWAVFNDRRDDTKPTWVVGLDVTFPTAALYDPAANRGTNWQSPHGIEARRGPAGEKVWKWDLHTALSRRYGPVDPYFRAHVTAMSHSSGTYSNCDRAAELAARGEMTLASVENCQAARWNGEAGAKLPWIFGLTFGTEIVPYEDRAQDQKVTVDLRVFGDYTTRHRFYNELTDASGKLHMTEGYLTMGAMAGLYLRASQFVSFHATASLAAKTGHYLTGESLGKSRGEIPPGDLSGATPNPYLNPNFDWRYDAPGSRFRLSDVSVFSLSVAGVLSF